MLITICAVRIVSASGGIRPRLLQSVVKSVASGGIRAALGNFNIKIVCLEGQIHRQNNLPHTRHNARLGK